MYFNAPRIALENGRPSALERREEHCGQYLFPYDPDTLILTSEEIINYIKAESESKYPLITIALVIDSLDWSVDYEINYSIGLSVKMSEFLSLGIESLSELFVSWLNEHKKMIGMKLIRQSSFRLKFLKLKDIP